MDNQYENVSCLSGTVIMLIYFLLSSFPFVKLIKGKTYYDDTPLVFVIGNYLNYLIWFIYAKMIENEQIMYYHGLGCAFSILFFVIYLIYEAQELLVDAILNFLLLITGTFAMYRAVDIFIDDEDIVGKICMSSSGLIVLTPIFYFYQDYKNNPNFVNNKFFKSNYLTFVSIIGYLCWIAYGHINEDENIYRANVIAIIASLIQILVWLIFHKLARRNAKKAKEEEKTVQTFEKVNNAMEENSELK